MVVFYGAQEAVFEDELSLMDVPHKPMVLNLHSRSSLMSPFCSHVRSRTCSSAHCHRTRRSPARHPGNGGTIPLLMTNRELQVRVSCNSWWNINNPSSEWARVFNARRWKLLLLLRDEDKFEECLGNYLESSNVAHILWEVPPSELLPRLRDPLNFN